MPKLMTAVCVVLALAGVVQAAALDLQVTTDHASYALGQPVSWTLLAWAMPDNAGIASLSVDLLSTDAELIQPALTTGAGATLSLQGSLYDAAHGFELFSAGVPAQAGLLDITVVQMPGSRQINVGNDGMAHVLAQGQFLAGETGLQTLTPSLVAANYWPDATGNALAFTAGTITPASYTVLAAVNGDANMDGEVNDADLSLLLANWAGSGKTWGQGDFNADQNVNDADLSILLANWGFGVSVPEPACLSLLALASLLRRRR